MPDLVDAVVVGGGIVGTAITLALARRNLRVTLLEASRLGAGATGGGFGWINATAKTDDETYFRLNAQGVAYYERLASEWGEERLGIHAGGALFWTEGNDGPGAERLRTRARLLQSWNYPAALLARGEIAVLEPSLVPAAPPARAASSAFSAGEGARTAPMGAGSGGASGDNGSAALFAPADRWADTARLCRFFVEQARAHKADIRLDCAATGFTRSVGNAISTIETAQGRIATRLLVVAAGAATPRLAALATGDPHAARYVPVQRVPGLLVQTPPLPRGASCQRILYPPDAHGLHLRPTPDGGVLVGADDTDALLTAPDNPPDFSLSDLNTLDFSGTDDCRAGLLNSLPPAMWRGLLARAARWLPVLSTPDVAAHSVPRICVRPVPADGLPIVGALPGVPGAYVAVTHSGVTLGPLLAELLAGEMFTRIPAPLLAPYRPDRFR